MCVKENGETSIRKDIFWFRRLNRCRGFEFGFYNRWRFEQSCISGFDEQTMEVLCFEIRSTLIGTVVSSD